MIEALKLALEALERSVATCFDQYAHQQVMSQPDHFINQTITSLRQAIAELESQEPVALTDDEILDAAFSAYCRGENTRELFKIMRNSRLTCSIGWDRDELKAFARNIEALCTHPPQRTWVGLTDEEITALKHNGERYISSQDFARAVEAKLKQKNGFAEEKNT